MNNIFQSLLSTVAFALCAGTLQAQPVTCRVVDRPDNTALSHNYTNARTPLRQQHFIKLPVGSIRPARWVGNTFCPVVDIRSVKTLLKHERVL